MNILNKQLQTANKGWSSWADCLWGWDGYWKVKKVKNHQVLIKSQQNWLQQGVEQFAMRSIKFLSLFGIRKNWLRSGRSRSLYLFIGRAIKTDCSNYRGISLLPTMYKSLSNILLSRLTPCAEKIPGDHHCGFQLNRLMPNDPYMGRTAPLTSKRCILYIYSTNIGTEYSKHALYSPFFFSSKCSLFHNAN